MMSSPLQYKARERSRQRNCRHIRLLKNHIFADEGVRRGIAEESGDEDGYIENFFSNE